MLHYFGYKHGKHNVFETEEGVLLEFRGVDAGKFVQLHPPVTKKVVPVELTEGNFLEQVVPAEERFVESTESWEVGQCEAGHTVVTLLDEDDAPFAEAHIGDADEVDHFILTLIDGCRGCMIERLGKLIAKVSGPADETRQTQLAAA